MKRREKFDKRGTLAMRADFWGLFFDVKEPAEDFELRGNAAIVSIEGPLTHHNDWWCDSYDAIKSRVAKALDSSASTVVLRIHSPGGDVSGCFETAREIRAMAATAGKKLVSYADEMAASAGYALACCGETIALSESSYVGSIGAITTLIDCVGMNEKYGIHVEVVASGEKKKYGHPDVPISPAAKAARQEEVDYFGSLFCSYVAEARGVPSQRIADLDAGMAIGAKAVEQRLADRVCSFEELLAELSSSSGANTAPRAAATEEKMGWKDDVKKAAEEGDEDAKKCLEAMGDDDPPKDEEKKDGAEDKPKDDKAEGDADKPKDDEKKDDKAAARGRVAAPKALSAEQRLAAIEEREERTTLLASRPDFANDASLSKRMATAPLAAVRWNVENLPRVASPKTPAASAPPSKTSPTAHAGAVTPAFTRAEQENEGNGLTRRSTHADRLDAEMGFAASKPSIRREGTSLVCGVMTPSQARTHLKKNTARLEGAAPTEVK